MKAPLFALSLFALGLSDPSRAGEPKPASSTTHDTPAASTERFHLSDLLPRGFQKNPRLNLSIITEMTPAGKAIMPPTRDKPAYYVVKDGGLVEEGDVVAGERPPNTARLAQVMQTSLARSGYQPATGKNPPTLLIYYRWGVYNHLSGLSDPETGDELSEDLVVKNLRTRALLVGGAKFASELMYAVNYRQSGAMDRLRLDARTDMLVTLATSDLYFLLAAAYDSDAARRGEKKLLWTTRLSTDSQGLAMDDTLPALVANSGSYFGHETNGSVIYHPHMFEGRVEVGEATVVRDPPASSEQKPAPARKP